MIPALLLILAGILFLFWLTYTISVFTSVAIALASAIAAIARMLWIVLRALWQVAVAALENERGEAAPKPADQTNVIPFRKRG